MYPKINAAVRNHCRPKEEEIRKKSVFFEEQHRHKSCDKERIGGVTGVKPKLTTALNFPHQMVQTRIVTWSQSADPRFEDSRQLIRNRNSQRNENQNEDQIADFIIFGKEIKENHIQRNPDPRSRNHYPKTVESVAPQIVEEEEYFFVFGDDFVHNNT